MAPLVGAFAGLVVLLTLGDPGITIDEPLDVRPGRTYVSTLLKRGLGFFEPETVRAVFADNAEHPPLGRWLLGIASTFGEPFEGFLGGPDPFSVHAGRLAPMACFALLVGLVVAAAGRHYGRVAGVAAGLSLLMMPRVFAHAHLAALDTFVALTWTAALLAAERAITSRRPTPFMALAGLIWGLAILTKIHGWLLPPLVGVYALARLGPLRAILPLATWTIIGLAAFFAGWPWLWYETLPRLSGYFGTGWNRVALQVLYFGEVYRDTDIPWHYPWVYFALTVPIGLLALGVAGVRRTWRGRRTDGFGLLILGAILFFLVIFSTKVAVYDGERLFLAVFPLAAMAMGHGAAWAWETWPARWARGVLVVAFLAQGYGLVAYHPFGLSYYNLAIGGLPGAERLGLEPTYWSDPIDRALLDDLARVARPGDRVAVVPTLHHIQPAAATTPALLEKRISLLEQDALPTADWILVSRRTAYWPPGLAQSLAATEPVAVRGRQGVWLAGLWRGPGAVPPGASPPGAGPMRNVRPPNAIERPGEVVYNRSR